MRFNIVLFQPEIPQNTGNIGRTCVLTDTRLHLIRPLGFSTDDKYLRRSGMDYWPLLDVVYYDSFEEFYEINKGKNIYLATTKAGKYYDEVTYSEGDFIMFGRESSGVPREVHELFKDREIRIPMIKTSERSLNLSNSAAIIVYEALRQLGFPNMK